MVSDCRSTQVMVQNASEIRTIGPPNKPHLTSQMRSSLLCAGVDKTYNVSKYASPHSAYKRTAHETEVIAPYSMENQKPWTHFRTLPLVFTNGTEIEDSQSSSITVAAMRRDAGFAIRQVLYLLPFPLCIPWSRLNPRTCRGGGQTDLPAWILVNRSREKRRIATKL